MPTSAPDSPDAQGAVSVLKAPRDGAEATEETGTDRPAAPSFAANLRDASRLVHFWSRREWRALPLEFVLIPCIDAPVLVHDSPPLFRDPATGRVCLALAMLGDRREAFRGMRDPIKRAMFFRLLRDLWCQIVDQADYYAWPDAPQALYEFAPDA